MHQTCATLNSSFAPNVRFAWATWRFLASRRCCCRPISSTVLELSLDQQLPTCASSHHHQQELFTTSNKTMAHRMHSAVGPIDVLRASDNERVVTAALQKVAATPEAAETLLALVIGHSGECTATALAAAFAALMRTGQQQSVCALMELSRSLAGAQPGEDLRDVDDDEEVATAAAVAAAAAAARAGSLDLYGAARELPMAALMRHCDCCGDEALEAMAEADLNSLGDLILYCSDGEESSEGASIERHIGALALEVGGAIDKPALRRLVRLAFELFASTSKLRDRLVGGSNAAGERLGGGDGWGGAIGGGDSSAIQQAWGAAGEASEAAADEAAAVDNSVEVAGPTPGTRSVGC